MLDKIQAQVIKQYPQLQHKSDIFQYFVSLQYPQKQRKLINWWETMIDCAIRKSGDLCLSPADLQILFSLHGLKPAPLEKVLQYLQDAGRIQWEGKKKEDKNKQNTGWLSSLTSYIWKPSTPNPTNSTYKSLQLRQSQKIWSKKYNNQLEQKIKQIITHELQHENSISYDYILNKLKFELPVGLKSIQILMQHLQSKGWLYIDFIQNKKIILRSNDKKQMDSKIWIEAEKSKFLLKTSIQQFDRKIQQRFRQEDKKLQQAKAIVESDQTRAKRILGEVRVMRKTTVEYQNRRKLLKQTLESIQMNQMTSSTIDVMNQCQIVLKKTMIDPNELQVVKDRHLQIEMNQRQINQQLQAMSGMNVGQIEDEVDQMMAQLSKQIKTKKKQQQNEAVIKNKFSNRPITSTKQNKQYQN